MLGIFDVKRIEVKGGFLGGRVEIGDVIDTVTGNEVEKNYQIDRREDQ